MAIASMPNTGARRQRGAFLFLFLMVFFGSTTATAAKIAVNGFGGDEGIPVGLLPEVRFGLAGLALLFYIGPLAVWRVWQTDRARLLLAAALCVPINQCFFLNGTRFAPTSHVAFIYATCPLVVLLLATALGQERLNTGRLIGVVITVVGALVLALGNLIHHAPGGARLELRGDLLLIGAVVSWGCYITVNKPLVERRGSLATLTATFLLGAVLNLPFGLRALVYDHAALAAASASAWWALLYLSLVVTIVAFACQNMALRQLDATQVATVGNAAPLLTVLWGMLLLREKLTMAIVVGGALILIGIARASWADRVPREVEVPRPSSPRGTMA